MNKREVGGRQEEAACRFLMDSGLRILERNWRVRIGEIDIIATEGDTVCFVEVKYRASLKYGGANYAIPLKKQQTIRRVAQWYIASHKLPPEASYRFDAVLIDGDEIQYVRNAW